MRAGSRWRLIALLGLAAAAGALAWQLVWAHLERGCVIEDTPYLDLCPDHAAAGPSPDYLAGLRSRLAANPGDSAALVRLAFFSQGAARDGVLLLGQRLAPADPNILALRAARALAAQDWPGAAAALVPLVEYHANADAARALAGMLAAGQAPVLQPLLVPGSVWLGRVLERLGEAGVPYSAALSLVAHGVKQGIVPRSDALASIRQLKARGAWVDAYALWAAIQPGPLPLLFNSAFDQAFQPDGFDWELIERARPGVTVGIDADPARRGGVLVLDYNGREIPVPQLRQHVYLAPGSYRFEGLYRATRLRIEHGLVWTVRCADGRREAARTPPLGDTAGRWQPFSLELTWGSDCGPVAALGLETTLPVEAATGARGRAEFAELRLGRVDRRR